MSQDSSTDGFPRTRRVLGDLTNRPTKRGFSMISADSGTKSGDGYAKNVDTEIRDSKLAKKVPLRVENLAREKCETTKSVAECNPEAALSSPKGTQESELSPTWSEAYFSTNENSDSATLSMSNDIGEKSSDSGANATSVLDVGEALMDNCSSIVSNSQCSGMCKNDCCDGGEKCRYEKAGQPSEVNQNMPLHEGLVTVVRGNDKKDFDVRNLGSVKYGDSECSKFPMSQGCSKSHEFKMLERCTTLKGDGSADLNVGDDSLKDCPCSFCLKAAHILSDLHYKDIKGRIAALKKSQKEASLLVEKCLKGKEIDIRGRLHPNKGSKLESDLTTQWRSLFLNVEDMLVHESNHLQESFVTLRNLRDDCKMELEMISRMPSEKQ